MIIPDPERMAPPYEVPPLTPQIAAVQEKLKKLKFEIYFVFGIERREIIQK